MSASRPPPTPMPGRGRLVGCEPPSWGATLTLLFLASLPVLVALLLACSTAPTPVPDYGYDGLRRPPELMTKAEPFVPPPAPKETEAPKVDPCAKACAAYNAADAKCDRLAEACEKMRQQTGFIRGQTCTEKEQVCARVIETRANLGACNCDP